MLKNIRERFTDFFIKPNTPLPLTEDSPLRDIALQHDSLYDFIERKYGLKVDVEDRTLTLRKFVDKYGLPPAQILFMEVQMRSRVEALKTISAQEARELLNVSTGLKILDVREEWETRYGSLPSAELLKPELLDQLLNEWPRDTKILVYCHYGIRSMDAATFLIDRGFTQVFTLQGGIESWSVNIDPSVPRYESAYC